MDFSHQPLRRQFRLKNHAGRAGPFQSPGICQLVLVRGSRKGYQERSPPRCGQFSDRGCAGPRNHQVGLRQCPWHVLDKSVDLGSYAMFQKSLAHCIIVSFPRLVDHLEPSRFAPQERSTLGHQLR